MEGMVHSLNAGEGLVAIDTAAGYTVFEQIGPDFEVGDFVSWTPSARSARATCAMSPAVAMSASIS